MDQVLKSINSIKVELEACRELEQELKERERALHKDLAAMLVGRKVKVKDGAAVGGDHCVRRYPDIPYGDLDIVFTIQKTLGTRCNLVARKFGVMGQGDLYGNGSIYANPEDLIFINQAPKA